jgi:hypothetical protein
LVIVRVVDRVIAAMDDNFVLLGGTLARIELTRGLLLHTHLTEVVVRVSLIATSSSIACFLRQTIAALVQYYIVLLRNLRLLFRVRLSVAELLRGR